jgi:hypothetical protein
MEPKNIILFVVIIVLLIIVIGYISKDVNTLTGLTEGTTLQKIEASDLDTTNSNSSNFTYSIWFYVNDFNYRYGDPKVIFGRMGTPSKQGSVAGVPGLDPCPVVVLGAVENTLEISLGCFPGINQTPSTSKGNSVVHTCKVSNIPIQKWVNLTISVYGRSMDVYLSGKLVKTCLLPGVANINNSSNVYVTPSGGFDGWTAKLQYYPNSLNPQEAWNIYSKGYSNFMSMFNQFQIQICHAQNNVWMRKELV